MKDIEEICTDLCFRLLHTLKTFRNFRSFQKAILNNYVVPIPVQFDCSCTIPLHKECKLVSKY